MDLDHDIRELGGLAATHELYKRRWTKYQLAAAVREGTVIRVRQGWYASPPTPDLHTRAARVGGHLSCVSAAAGIGLWVRRSPVMHVAVNPRTARLRHSFDKQKRLSQHPDATTIVHWTERHAASGRFISGLRQILQDMVWCQSPENVVAAVDSAIHSGWLTLEQWRADIAGLPKRLRRLLAMVDPTSESWLESIMRFRLRMLGIGTLLQVRISGLGYVDLLIGRSLVIELDGWEFHGTRKQFEEDRRRDARLAVLGFRVLRFTYRQLTRSWSAVRAAVLACIARGEHL